MMTSATTAFKNSTAAGSSYGKLDKAKNIRSNVISPAQNKELSSGNADLFLSKGLQTPPRMRSPAKISHASTS